MSQDYNSYTYNDPNPIKRHLHRQRFDYALKLLNLNKRKNILDYGCGDGHFLYLSYKNYPDNYYFGYEPYPGMYQQAEKKLVSTPVKIYSDLNDLKEKKYDKITCLETAEHLDKKDLDILFNNIILLLKEKGQVIISVPIETGLPALFKNLYRFLKNKKYEGLNFINFIKSILGLIIKRKKIEISPGIEYYFSHIGFNHRKFENLLKKYFKITKKKYLPCNFFKGLLNNTVYFLVQKK
ncbi:MAG: class I SAM-dependent methyltransferase [Patescibacteria group bacterium]|nr:class I SAM-dependent methyltransferase [Patescibacteria group bacterium]